MQRRSAGAFLSTGAAAGASLRSRAAIPLRAAHFFFRRWPLFAATCFTVCAMQLAFFSFVHVRMADLYASLIGPPLVIAVVGVYVGADATENLPAASERWSRILERAWAIIVLDVALSLLSVAAFVSISVAAPGVANIVLSLLLMIFSAMLIYAEPFLCVQDGISAVALLPLAILRSMMLAWTNMSRIFSLFAVQLAVQIAILYAVQWAGAQGMRQPQAWIGLSLGTLATAPLAALFTVAYLETLAQERAASAP